MNDINNYLELKQAIQSWLNRKDSATIDKIPLFINFACKQFTRLIKLPYYESLLKANAIPGLPYHNIPNDFLSAKHLMVNGAPYTRVDTDTFQRMKVGLGTQRPPEPRTYEIGQLQGATTSLENYFTRIGDQIHFIPELKEGDTFEMIYRRDIPEFQNDSDSPYFLLVASDVLLYLALRHAAIFLRDNEQEMYWNQKATDAAEALQQQLDDAEWSGSSLVVPMFYQ